MHQRDPTTPAIVEQARAVADAKAILKAWADQRETWAAKMLEASVDNAALDVASWSDADRSFKQMASARSREHPETASQG